MQMYAGRSAFCAQHMPSSRPATSERRGAASLEGICMYVCMYYVYGWTDGYTNVYV